MLDVRTNGQAHSELKDSGNACDEIDNDRKSNPIYSPDVGSSVG
jgi:hypothetical protein